MIIVRYADDFVVGFQHRDGRRAVPGRAARSDSAKFGLELHPDKTRLIEFGPLRGREPEAAWRGKPETFDFLGFTHICGETRREGSACCGRRCATAMRAKLQERSRPSSGGACTIPIPEVGRWLRAVLRGHFRYYGVPRTSTRSDTLPQPGRPALVRDASASEPEDTAHLGADEPARAPLAPRPANLSSLSRSSACASPPEAGAQCGSSARWDLCGGPRETAVPTPTLVGCCRFRNSRMSDEDGRHHPSQSRGLTSLTADAIPL